MIAGDGPRPAPMLSTGVPSTLKNWHALCAATFGADSRATQFIKGKLDEQGPDMAVLSDEGQLVHALIQMHVVGLTSTEEGTPTT